MKKASNGLTAFVRVVLPGVTALALVARWFFGGTSIKELLQDLRSGLTKCRPDWDNTTPVMEFRWNQGRKQLCHP
jgi:hypothetical protein